MDQHKTYDKEKVLKKEEDKPKKFIWSYIIKPVRKDYN
jgi:hypothetical protein